MDIGPDAIDYGDAPRIAATGISRIFFISPNVIRIACCCRHMRDDGMMELRIAAYVDWDIDEFCAVHETLHGKMAELLAEAKRDYALSKARFGAQH